MKIINENLLPETLTEKDFDRWNESFFDFIGSHYLFTAYELDQYIKFDYKDARGDLSIEISLETPTSEYGLYSSEEIKEIAKKIIKKNVSNPNQILSDIDKVEDIDVEKIDFIYRHNRSEEFECVLHKIYELINEKKHTELVLGEYVIGKNEHNKKDGKIILYLNNIKKECSSNIIEKIEQTYIHEFFHHFHNCVSFGGNNIEEFSHRNDYPSIVIKESLAKFFELNYMKFYYSFNYNEKIEELRQYVVSAYPYSGATYIKDGYDIISNKSYDCFIEFSKLYIMSFDEALSYLLSNNEEEYKKVLEHDNKYKSILTGIRKKDY